MLQDLVEEHRLDAHGNPSGGITVGLGIKIEWQEGPLGRGKDRQDPNGAFVEGVIQAAIGRLQFYQTAGKKTLMDPYGKFACRENSLALTHLEEALHWLQARTASREARQVEGTHQA